MDGWIVLHSQLCFWEGEGLPWERAPQNMEAQPVKSTCQCTWLHTHCYERVHNENLPSQWAPSKENLLVNSRCHPRPWSSHWAHKSGRCLSAAGAISAWAVATSPADRPKRFKQRMKTGELVEITAQQGQENSNTLKRWPQARTFQQRPFGLDFFPLLPVTIKRRDARHLMYSISQLSHARCSFLCVYRWTVRKADPNNTFHVAETH